MASLDQVQKQPCGVQIRGLSSGHVSIVGAPAAGLAALGSVVAAIGSARAASCAWAAHPDISSAPAATMHQRLAAYVLAERRGASAIDAAKEGSPS